MVNFGPRESVPQKFNDRTFYEHNTTVTLMRTTADENRQLGEIIARKMNQATAPTALFVPLRGVSMIDAPDQPFHDPQADEALFAALRQHVDAKTVELIEIDCHINDDEFSIAMADKLLSLIAN